MKKYARICLFLLFFPLFLQAKVYDCFLFFNELELLKMRLEEMDSVVDHFVLVEATETHRGKPKPLYFQENRALFEKYLPKIIHIVVDERKPELGVDAREVFQRNCISRGLKDCQATDIILISDLDEIPRASVIASLKTRILSSKVLTDTQPPPFAKAKHKKKYEQKFARLGAYALQQNNYYYQLNRQLPAKEDGEEVWHARKWCGTVVTTYDKFAKKNPQYFRQKRNQLPRLPNAGWHFTWIGGKEKIRQKLCAIAEGRDDGHLVTDEEIEKWLSNHPVVPIDDSYPEYVRNNQASLKAQGFIADY